MTDEVVMMLLLLASSIMLLMIEPSSTVSMPYMGRLLRSSLRSSMLTLTVCNLEMKHDMMITIR